MPATKTLALVSLVALWAVCAGAAPRPERPITAERMRAHVTFLASDLLEGRDSGSRGFDIAAEYVASQFRQLGLTPAGDGGTYFQAVPLLAFRPAGEGALVLRGPGDAAQPLAFGEDFLPGHLPSAGVTRVAAPLVFVGFGVVAPETGRDDYRDLDVRGKIVVAIAGAPGLMQPDERAYYASTRIKRTLAARRGAVGFISLYTPIAEQRRPFADGRRTWDSWAMTWRGPDGAGFDPAPAAPALATLSVKGAAKLFAGAPASFAQVMAAAEDAAGDPPRFGLPLSLDARIESETRLLESRNVAAILPGTDSKRKAEAVVLTAHLDHLGITRPINGDSINNGALDNASGVATALEVARTFVESGRPGRRSILFLMLTGEEKGLVGAEYFARRPSGPTERIVSEVNIDMPVLTYDFTNVVAFGAERSSIGPAAARAAARVGVKLSADPLPEEGFFTRSDHYRFVEAGVPSVFLMTGFANGGEAAFTSFLANCYHKPCDDLSLPIDWNAGARFVRINYELTRELAEARKRPTWNKGDFFARKYAAGLQRQP